jgi:hypothetical protein
MEWLNGALAAAGDDPVLLALLFLGLWVPLCAAGLAVLAGLAALQEQWLRRSKPRPSVMLPPGDLRPLAARRYLTVGARTRGVAGLARVALAIMAVLGFTAAVLVATGTSLLPPTAR